MARRRRGAVQAAAGDAWRQQQQLAALAAALQRLPRSDALPLALLLAVQRALRCVDHTLRGPPSSGAAAEEGGSPDVTPASAVPVTRDGVTGGGSSGSDADVTPAGRDARAGAEQEVMNRDVVAVKGSGGQSGVSAERLAAQRAAAILRAALASVAAGGSSFNSSSSSGGGGGAGGQGGAGRTAGWCSSSYAVALLHSYLALSSDLFMAATEETPVGWRELRWDGLAAAARPRLSTVMYAQVVEVMGWEAQLVELLSWTPDPRVMMDALARVVEVCPGVVPGLVAALTTGSGGGSDSGPGDDSSGSTCSAGPVQQGPPGFSYTLSALELRAIRSPRLVLRLAGAVRQASAAAAAAATGVDGGGGEPDVLEGGRWLQCMLVLGRALVDALRGSVIATATDVAEFSEAAGDWEGISAWAEACCEALQEGLCVWQADIISYSRGAGAVGSTHAAAAAAALFRLLQGELKAALDELQVGDGGGARGPAEGDAAQLPYAAVVRLRSRIALLAVQAGSAAPAPSQPPSRLSTAAAGPGRPAAAGHLTAGDVWRDLAGPGPGPGPGPAVSVESPSAGLEAAIWTTAAVGGQALPDWLRMATAPSSSSSSAASVLAYLRPASTLGSSAGGQLRPCSGASGPLVAPVAAAGAAAAAVAAAAASGRSAPAGMAATTATAHVAAVAIALLTPGVASWLQVQRDSRVTFAAGPDPFSPFRVALALLELLQGRLGSGDGPPDPWVSAACLVGQVGTDGAALCPQAVAVDSSQPVGTGQKQQQREEGGAGAGRQLELRVLRMAVECLACVGNPQQQGVLQEVVLGTTMLSSLRRRLATDADLQIAAGRALVALSNRAAAMEGSLERMALSAQQEAQRLAAAATDLLPYAVLVPEACVRRLVLDGLTHPGQQPWVLQLLRCFAVAAVGDGDAATDVESLTPPVLLSCVRTVVLGDAPSWLRTAAERRSLLSLLGGLVEAGLLAPRELLAEVVQRGLSCIDAADCGGRRLQSVAQVHCAMLVAQLLLGASGGAELPAAYSPAAELAAARPARLLLAAAAALGELYRLYESIGQLEAGAIDVGTAVLEVAVQLYGEHLVPARAVAAARGPGGGEGVVAGVRFPDVANARELRELLEGSAALPRRLLSVLLPLLDLAATTCGSGGDEGGDGSAEDAVADRSRALSAQLVPAARWRPRSLRAADAAFARTILWDTMIFAAASAGKAGAVRRALLDAAAAADEDNASAPLESTAATPAAAPPSVWEVWGEEVVSKGAMTTDAAATNEGAVSRHVAATAARGLPLLPPSSLLDGCVAALGELLPVASPDQARRLLLGLLPALVQAAGGPAAILAAACAAAPDLSASEGGSSSALAAAGAPAGGQPEAPSTAAVLSGETLAGWLLVRSTAAPAAAAVAVSMMLACRGSMAALRSGSPLQPAAAIATADRCASHVALMASRLAAVAATAASSEHPEPGARQDGTKLALEIAVVATVMLCEVCQVAKAASEGAASGDQSAMDVWQAIILSILQSLVVALAAWGRGQGGTEATPMEAAKAVELLRGTHRMMGSLPGPAADVLAAALERLCEDQEVASGAGEGEQGCPIPGRRGWLLAALLVEDGVLKDGSLLHG